MSSSKNASFSADLSADEISTALQYIDANLSRDDWVKIGMAIKSELGDSEGFDIFDAWSQNADSYNARDCRDTWRSIKSGGGIGIGTLIKQAQDGGYRKNTTDAPKTIDPAAAEERRARRAADELRDAEETARRQARAASEASAMWQAAQKFTGHDYTDRKNITNPGVVRVGTYRRWLNGGYVDIPNALIIPIRDASNAITSVQAIFPDDDNPLGRDREYLPSGKIRGSYFNIGKPTGETGELILIGEGLATVASAQNACGGVGVVAFDAGNLPAIARIMRDKRPDADIVMLADNDRFGARNTGIEQATIAARAISGKIAIPQFKTDDGQPTDFNDLQLLEGSEVVRAQVMGAVAVDSVKTKPTPEPIVAETENPVSEINHDDSSGFSWSKPLDVFGVRQPPALPLDVMPQSFQAYIKDQSAQLGCDPAIIGIGLIVAAAAATTDDVKLQPKRKDPHWLENPRVWAAIVGDPSTRKSPGISTAVRFIKRIDYSMAADNAAAFADYKHQHDSWKDARKADKSLPEPKQPPTHRLVVEDVTVEALTEILKDNPRGILTLKDELTGWFASMDAYKSGGKGASMDRAHWLESYNGGHRVIDRISRGNVVVPNWSTCILGGVQPDIMRSIAKSMGNDGLLQRFMIVCARPAIAGTDNDPDYNAINTVESIFNQLSAIQAGGHKPVKFSEGAHENRLRVADYSLRLVSAIDSPHLKAWLGKWDGLFARLCIIYHVIDCAERYVHPTSENVSGAIAAKVERLMCGFLLHHALHFYNEIIDANDRQDHVRQLARMILARQFIRITKRDITLYWKASQKFEWYQVRSVIDVLCTMGWLEPETGMIDTDGKPRSWIVNPAVHTDFEGHAEAEKTRRRDATRMLKELFEAHSSDQS